MKRERCIFAGGTRRHGVLADHVVGVIFGDRLWLCSVCGTADYWSDTWQWFGTYECRHCGRDEIEHVTCSAACRAKVQEAA